MNIYSVPEQLLTSLPIGWSFMLLLTRYIALLTTMPGIGLGARGLIVRVPAAMVMSYASLGASNYATLPDNWAVMSGALLTELLFGSALGIIPLLIVTGVQTGATIASTSMGLNASSLMDPTSGTQVSELARIFGDFTVILFLFFGGHYMILHAASGLGDAFAPGSLYYGVGTVNVLIDKSGDIFRIGAMVSAPVVVALLLTQFVMGMLSRAVPTVNIFIVSFPLTIGIGLMLSVLVLPELVVFVKKEIREMEGTVIAVVDDRAQATKIVSPQFDPIKPIAK